MSFQRIWSWDDYYIPGTEVLRNKFVTEKEPYGVENPSRLDVLEDLYAEIRMRQLVDYPIDASFDYAHMKAIHYYIFQDVYEWAGQERTAPNVPMYKGTHAYYPAGPQLTAAAEEQYALIAAANYLRGMERPEFIAELAERWGEINIIHSFREGNTRSQCVFFSQLSQQAGYYFPPDAFKMGSPLREAFINARFHSQDTGSNAQLAHVLDQVITPIQPARTLVQEHLAQQPRTPKVTRDEVLKAIYRAQSSAGAPPSSMDPRRKLPYRGQRPYDQNGPNLGQGYKLGR
ncbi:MAG: Fic family protein [Actinomycetaceae bacterium]|nr:Fic family protein [Actinomycetaceae bacterium]